MTDGLAIRLGLLRARIGAAVAARDAQALAAADGAVRALLPELAATGQPDGALRQAVDDLLSAIAAAEAALSPVLAEMGLQERRDRRLRGAYR